MKTVYKYRLEMTDEQYLKIPYEASLLHAGEDANGDPCVWVLVDTLTTVPTSTRVFIVGTGQPIPASASQYVGTWVSGPFVWHLFAE